MASVNFLVDVFRPFVGQELVNVADSCSRNHPLHGDSVPPRELHLQVLQQLELRVVRASAPRAELAMRTLAGVALVVSFSIWNEVALAQSSACPDATLRRSISWHATIQVDDLVICQCQHSVALSDEVVDQLDAPNLKVPLDLLRIDDPIQIRETTLAVDDDTCQGEDGNCDPRIARHPAVLRDEDLYNVLQGLEHDVRVLNFLREAARSHFPGFNDLVWRDRIEHQS
mmetsp:Transcript_31478/g.66870  ORF Transcript_31478/g.66870 Transcript_31478/m.66870 type:complete len:228 (+) Transcript_31478:644-1327(+)